MTDTRAPAPDHAPEPARSRRPGWLATSILGTAGLAVMSGAAQFGVTAVLGDVAVAFGAASESEVTATVGLSASTLGLGLAVIRLAGAGSLFGSSLADRWGRRRVLVASAAVGLALTGLAAGMPTFWAFIAVIALSRPLLSSVNALSVVVASEETGPQDRAWAIGFVGGAYALGSGLVSVLRGAFEGAGFRTIVAATAVPLILIPLLARIIGEPPPAEAVHDDEPQLRFTGVPAAVRPRLVIVTVLIGIIAVATGPAFTYLFVYGENVLGASPGFMAMLVLAAAPAGLAGLLFGRWAADRFGRRITAGVATVALIVAVVVTYSGSRDLFAVGYLAAIASSGAFGPASGALLNELVPTRYRGTANGWAAAAGVVGAVLGLGLFGLLTETLGGFPAAARWLFLPLVPLAYLYTRLPETRGVDLDDDAVLGG